MEESRREKCVDCHISSKMFISFVFLGSKSISVVCLSIIQYLTFLFNTKTTQRKEMNEGGDEETIEGMSTTERFFLI
jgi:hypothetical protein